MCKEPCEIRHGLDLDFFAGLEFVREEFLNEARADKPDKAQEFRFIQMKQANLNVDSARLNPYHLKKIVTPSTEGGDAHVCHQCENVS
jgi:hypothetical protein